MKRNAFTLVELLAVIAILAILIIIALPNVLKMYTNAKKDVFLNEVKTLYKESEKKVIEEATNGNKIDFISSNSPTALNMTGHKIQYCINLINNKVSSISVSDGKYYVVIPSIDSIDQISADNVLEGGYENLSCDSSFDCAENPFDSNTLKYKILSDNCVFPDDIRSTFVSNENGIDFTKSNDSCYFYEDSNNNYQRCDSNGKNNNGKGVYYATDSNMTEGGETVYYYRGNINNNYVVFSGYCWKIVRTTEDGGIRLFYWGNASSNNTCSNNASPIAYSRFNNTYGDNSYIGYMMGLNNSCTAGSCLGSSNSTSYNQAHSNTYNSTIKKVIDAWYTGNNATQVDCYAYGETTCNFSQLDWKLSNSSYLISDTPYCNDRTVAPGRELYEITFTTLGYGTNATLYNVVTRLGLGNTSYYSDNNNNPSFVCSRKNDKFTVSNNDGNRSLTYPVGLITSDEVIFAGGSSYYNNNQTHYLVTNETYWTMSPHGYHNQMSAVNIVYSDGALDSAFEVSEELAVFPVITLNPSVRVLPSGTGTTSKPYIIAID